MATATENAIALLSTLSPGERAEFLAATRTQNHAAGTQIISEFDEDRDIFFLIDGRVVAKSFSEQGYEVSYVELGPGAVFGEFSAIDGRARASAVEAIADSTVVRLDRARFRGFIGRFPALGLALAEHLVARVRALSERIFEFSTLSVGARVRLELIRLARSAGSARGPVTIKPAPTHQEIAARISTHREAVSRELGLLKKQKLVTTSRQAIVIADIAALRRSVGD